jgi:hypothetical protein
MPPGYLKLRGALLAGLSCCALLLSACATTVPKANDIEQRVTQRWNLVLSGDLAEAYEYLSPGYRSSVTSTQYQRAILLNKVKWTGVRYIESDCTETVCKVKISIDYTLYGALPGVKSFEGTQAVEESWVLSDGNWYFVPNK